jgi:PPM family protein phosphatase
MSISIVSTAESVAGRRPNNEDFAITDETLGLYVVADSTASRGGGQTAAKLACETSQAVIAHRAADLEGATPQQVSAIINETIVSANEHILEVQKSDAALRRMATTIALVLHRDREIHIGWVGDSRIFLWRGGELKQLTRDHSLENYLKDNPHIKPAVQRPGKTLVSALGLAEAKLRIDFVHESLQGDDLVLICSDGLTDALPPWLLAEILSGALDTSVAETAPCLVRAALSHGGMDNITAVLLQAVDKDAAKYNLQGATVLIDQEEIAKGTASAPRINLGWLTFLEGPRLGEVCTVDRRLTIGAAAGSDIVVTDDFCSSRHAEVYPTEHGFALRDLDSTNGTFINGAKVKLQNLLDGDTVRIGSSPIVFKSCRLYR